MFIYIVALLIFVLLSYWAQKCQSSRVVLALSVLFVCFTGFRAYSVGIDTENYIEIWNTVLAGRIAYVEPGFIWLCEFLQRYTDNPTILFLVCSAIIYPLIIFRLWDYRYIASFPMMIATFYMCDLMISMNVVRQYMAVAIVFYFSKYLFRGNYLVYLIGVILATTLHYSSLIALALFSTELLRWKYLSKPNKFFIVSGMAMLPIAFGIILNFASTEYGGYFSSVNNSEIGMLTMLKGLFILLSCFIFNIFKRNKYSSDDTYKMIMIIIIFSLIGLSFETLEYFFPFMGRVGILFHMFFLIFWGVLYKRNKGINIFICLVCYLLLIVYPFVSSIIGNGQGTVPFEFVF